MNGRLSTFRAYKYSTHFSTLTDNQAREAFHFTLLRRLVEQVPNGLRPKGGVNLRPFFDGVRYSEDMDLDAAINLPATHTPPSLIQAAPTPMKPRRAR